ncbi:MAG: aminotransferase class III-fold pyridoxal phosphate-dependent enzyme [Roseiflexaceae bacterium]
MVAVTHQPPRFSLAEAAEIAALHYGIHAEAVALPGEYDQNIRLTTAQGEQFVLRIAHVGEDADLLEAQNAALEHVAAHAPGYHFQRLIRSLQGQALVRIPSPDGGDHLVRLLTFVPGRLMAESRPHSPALLQSLGGTLAALDQALLSFAHPATHRTLKWDLLQAEWAAEYLDVVADPQRRALVAATLERFAACKPQLTQLRQSVIHNDANDYNVLVSGNGSSDLQVSVIDFGDMIATITVAELAIACAYAMLDKPDPLAAAAAVIAGYHAVLPLSEAEADLLDTLIRTRLAVSVINSAYQQTIHPANQYLQISARPAWALLERLAQIPAALATAFFRQACGFVPSPHSSAVVAWLSANQAAIAPVIQPDLRQHPQAAVVLDLSPGTLDFGTLADLTNTRRMDATINELIADAGATLAIGRYNEPRLIYRAPMFCMPANEGHEWRSIHIGLDLFAPVGTPIYAPLAGVVVSTHDNAGHLDYGPTIMLRHDPADGPGFYTLYGHLSRATLSHVQVGQAVAAGELIAWIGEAEVNGGWPPHLHLQLITDILGRDQAGEFPGVARPSERAIWTAFCPDPNLLVGLPAGRFPPALPAIPELLDVRRERIGYNLSISYRRPLHIVRGFMQHLYDAEGRVYLDSVNNVPHVGHQHPRVVRAAQRQAAVLNTNTRYLHSELLRYAERLSATMPKPLSVCFFVCSGSEATELALRLARAHTGRKNLIVSDGAYHGNTTTLIDISPYKSEGPGGKGLAPWVFKAPMPDTYRGPYKADHPEAGKAYAQLLTPILAQIEQQGGLSAFMIESLLSCGGQIVLPPGYLAEVYRLVRAAGGVCIADEVQVGFGRVGSHFWGFETQGVVPDIVAMGKPIGNGHPLGAVITTPEIAASFNNGMEYFNTYGGNPVSCMVGQAVLDVIADEGLQQQALLVGDRMLAGLRGLVDRHELVGDARGLGLMVGLELVRNRTTLEPADWEASYIANRARDYGILISTDGPLHNVLKIKPPLVYTLADADRLVETLDQILGEDALQPRGK